MPSGDSGDIPAIRTFQFDGTTQKALNNSVNLFRGDVNIHQHLLTLPDRNGQHELETNISIQYQSNVNELVTTRNLSAPTSILGVGWSFPHEHIIASHNNTASANSSEYFFVSGGIRTRLIRCNFKSHQHAEYYQLRDYQFWDIWYNPTREEWTIVKENGVVHSFGGGVGKTSQGYCTSFGNSIQWSVAFSNWIGTSADIKGQRQIASAWYVRSIANLWGDAVSFEYNGFARRSDGLIPGVEQLVGGAGGKPYTKAMYLTGITDLFGRIVSFRYGDKWYSVAKATDAREYADSHKAIADHSPNAFQDRYETRFLAAIEVHSVTGLELLKIDFAYYPPVNVTNFTGALAGDTHKRYLKSIVQSNAAGASLPGYQFDYYWQATSPNPGALKSLTYPHGAVATYSYSQRDLMVCHRRSDPIPAPPPGLIGNGFATPRIWFGSDYVVLTWTNETNGRLYLSVYNWLGYWQTWKPSNPVIFNEPAGFDLTSLNVAPREHQFTLWFCDGNNSYIYAYRRNPCRTGEWIPLKQGSSERIQIASVSVEIACGDNFILASSHDAANDNYTLLRTTWHWQTQQWLTEPAIISKTSNRLFICAHREYYVTLEYRAKNSSCELTLNYVDALLNWRQGDRVRFKVTPSSADDFTLAGGDSLIALAVITLNLSDHFDYELHVYNWDEAYQFRSPQVPPFALTQHTVAGRARPFAPQIVNNSNVYSGGHLLRYTGNTWVIDNNFDVTAPVDPNAQYWFAYGTDIVVKTVNSPAGITCEILSYDANSEKWNPVSTPKPLPVIPAANQNLAWFPTVSGEDYFTSGVEIYFRGPGVDWSTSTGISVDWPQSIARPLARLLPATSKIEIDTTGIVNRAPEFMVCLLPDFAAPTNTKIQVLSLKNNAIPTIETLHGETYSTHALVGQSPSGQQIFATFPAGKGNFAAAQSLTLYRFAGSSIARPVRSYSVSTLEIDDGTGLTQTVEYEFNDTMAACDPSGKVMKYYEATVFPGGKSQVSKNGCEVNHFINGRRQHHLDNFNMLDGMLLEKEIKNGAGSVVSATQNKWLTFEHRNSHPTKAEASPYRLYGGYVRLESVLSSHDGLQNRVDKTYLPTGFIAPYSGEVVETSTENYNANGDKEIHTVRHNFGYEHYPELADNNQLKAIVATTKLTNANITALTAHRWKDWGQGQWALASTYQARTFGAASKGFDFSAATPPATDDWLNPLNINNRNQHGQVAESNNIDGINHLVVMDKTGRFTVATFNNASNSNACYFGFEDYEVNPGWNFASGSMVISTGLSVAGKNCLQIAGNPAATGGLGITTYFTVNKQNPVYLLSCWLLTEENFDGVAGSAEWNMTINGSTIAKPVAITCTAGLWKYLYIPLDLSTTGVTGKVAVKCELINTKAGKYLLVDSLRFSPYSSEFNAHVYDNDHGVLIAELKTNGECIRYLYDRFHRPMATVDTNKQLDNLRVDYLSRQTSASFASAVPNHLLKVHARNGGPVCLFNEAGQQWQSLWKPTNPTAWQVDHGSLKHAGATTDTLALQQTIRSGHAGIYAKINPDDSVQLCSIAIGSATINWNKGTGWELQHTNGASISTRADNSSIVPEEWMILVSDTNILFYANGDQIFAYNGFSGAVAGAVSITVKGPVRLQDLAVFYDPVVSIEYTDGLNRKLQQQELVENGIIASASIHDDRGHAVVNTKKVLIANSLFGFRNDLVNYDPVNGIMTNCLLTARYPDDEGYPFYRKRYENSPLGRVVEKGKPGKAFAILPGSGSNTKKYLYGINKAGDWTALFNLPPGHYATTTTVHEDGSSSVILSDMAKKTIAKRVGPVAGGSASHHQQTWLQYDEAGNHVFTKLPNGIPGNIHDNQWQEHSQFDFAGRLMSTTRVDGSKARFLYDRAGRVRFAQDGEGTAKGYLIFNQYDLLGRLISSGTLFCDISSITQSQADDPEFLPKAATKTISKSVIYDRENSGSKANLPHYGGEPFLIGRTVKSITSSEPHRSTVTEQVRTDISGNVVSREIDIGNTGNAIRTEFVYNAMGQVIQTIYPQESPATPAFSIYHQYNMLGHLSAIGSKAGAADLASYTYTEDGRVKSETIAAGGAKAFLAGRRYNAPGWLAQIDYSPVITEKLSFTTGGFSAGGHAAGYFNGNIARIDSIFHYPGSPQGYSVSLAYNHLNRLLSAENSLGTKYSLGTANSSETRYDDNGNILGMQVGAAVTTYSYHHNNVLNTDGSSTRNYHYDANGNTVAVAAAATVNGQPLKIAYDKVNQRTAQITIGSAPSTELSFLYDSSARRVAKTVTGNNAYQKIYLHGKSTELLAEKTNSSWRQFIHGPAGLLAVRHDGAFYRVLRDHLGSTRALVEGDTGLVVATRDYLPFGRVFRQSGTIDFTSHLFAGLELDQETGLYHDGVRLYDAQLARFYSHDPKHQFPSPYLYAGNNPIIFVDPTGMMSIWGEIGMVAGAVAAVAAGIAITVVTGGADLPVLAAIGGGAVGGAVGGAGTADLMYQYQTGFNPHKWNWTQFGNAVALGAAGGAVSGGVSAGLSTAAQAYVGAAAMRYAASGAAESAEAEGAGEGAAASAATEVIEKTGRTSLNAFKPITIGTKIGSSMIANMAGTTAKQGMAELLNLPDGNSGFASQLGMAAATGLASGLLGAGAGAANQKWGLAESVKEFAKSHPYGTIGLAVGTAASMLTVSYGTHGLMQIVYPDG